MERTEIENKLRELRKEIREKHIEVFKLLEEATLIVDGYLEKLAGGIKTNG